jgi:hypothetical protein
VKDLTKPTEKDLNANKNAGTKRGVVSLPKIYLFSQGI